MIWLAWAWGAPCSNDSILDAVDAGLEAYRGLELEVFETAGTTVDGQVDCLTEVLQPDVAAAVHRFNGLRHFTARETESSARAFAASRRIEPAFVLPTGLVPEDNPVRELYASIDLASLEMVDLPRSARLRVDGDRATERATDLPAMVQRLDSNGGIANTWRLEPGQALPLEPEAPAKRSRRAPLRIVAAGVGAASIGLVGGALVTAGSYRDGVADPLQFESHAVYSETVGRRRNTANTLFASGIGAGAVAVGLGAVSLTGAF